MLSFQKIKWTDRPLFDRFCPAESERSCENAFINLLVWQPIYHNEFAVADGQLIVKSGEGEDAVFRLPMGGDMAKGLALIQAYSKNACPRFWVQEGALLDRFLALAGQDYCLTERRDAFDYLYRQSDLAELSGKKYHGKRNHIHAFSQQFDWHYEPIGAENLEQVRLCARQWYAEHGAAADRYLSCERQGLAEILAHWDALAVKGGAIVVDGRVVAFTVGSAISTEVFDIHIEKALNDYAGAYTVINREFAARALSAYAYINREDDMGLEGLRKAKLSYKPAILLKKYDCRPNRP